MCVCVLIKTSASSVKEKPSSRKPGCDGNAKPSRAATPNRIELSRDISVKKRH